MSGSKSGSRKPADDDGDDIAARISASIGEARNANRLAKQSDAAASLKTPRPVAIKNLRTLAPAQPQTADDEDDERLPQALEPAERPEGQLDMIWVIAAAGVLLLVGGTFLAFMAITSPSKEPVRRTFASPSPSIQVDFSGQPAYIVEYGGMPSPTPSPEPSVEASATAQATPLPTEEPVKLESLPPPPLPPAAALAPPPRTRVMTPPPLKPVAPPKLPAKGADEGPSAYRVLAGPYTSRNEAEASSGELQDLGKAIKIEEDKDKFWLVLGEPFSVQDDALSLAEQVVQRGKQVVVKKK